MVLRRGRTNLRVLFYVFLAAVALMIAYQFSRNARRPEIRAENESQPSSSDKAESITTRLPHLSALANPPAAASQDAKIANTQSDALSSMEKLPADSAGLLADCDQVLETLSASFPSLPDVYEVKARVANWRGNSTEAEQFWQKSLELDPNYGHAYFGMAKVAAQRGKLEESVELFQRALAVMPNFLEVEIELGRALINLDRTAEAIALFEKPAKRNSLSPEALCLLGQAYLQQKEYEQARDNYQAAVQADPQYAEAYFGLATATARLGQTEKSGEYTRKFRELNSKLMAIRTEERNNFEDLTALREDIASFYATVGKIYFVRGKSANAETIWLRAAALAPFNVECRQSLAFVYRKTGRFEKAIDTLEQLASIESDKTPYWLEIGRLNAQTGQFEAAEKAFQQVSNAAPNDPAGYAPLVEMYLDSNRKLPEALGLARKVLELNKSSSSYLLLAAALDRNGDLPGAKTALEEGLKLDSQNIACYLDLGRVHAALNDFPAAEKAFQTVSTIAPKNPAGYSALAQLYLLSGQKEKLPQSIELARKAAELDSSAPAYLLLSEAYRLNGLGEESAAAKRKAAELESKGQGQRPQ
jgi:tetratricopeptide (TPR) repeat protein